VTGADADGAELVRDPLFEKRTIPRRCASRSRPTMDQSLDGSRSSSRKLEEAEQQPDGLPLVWTPANSTKSITFYVLSGRGRRHPGRHPRIAGTSPTTSRPEHHADLQAVRVRALVASAATASGSTPLITVDLPSVGGDVPAEGHHRRHRPRDPRRAATSSGASSSATTRRQPDRPDPDRERADDIRVRRHVRRGHRRVLHQRDQRHRGGAADRGLRDRQPAARRDLPGPRPGAGL
jgi:hypothetical protein